MSRNFPHRVGETLTIRCEALAADGLGRATVASKEVRLRFAIPGEEANAVVTHVGQHAVWATVTEPVSPSVDRVKPPCPVVTECGGCPWQHITIEAQRRLRLEMLREGLASVPGAENVRWHPWLPGEVLDRGYRTRALMMLRHVRGKLRAGFYAPRSQDLVPAEECLVQAPRLQRLIPKIVSILDNHQLPTWRGPNRPGLVRAISLRTEYAKTPALLTIVATKIDPRLVTAAKHLVKLNGIAGVYGNVNDRDGGPVMGRDTFHLAGERRQPYTMGAVTLDLGPTAFVQTNQTAGTALVAQVLEWMTQDGIPVEHLADIYGGVGVFGLNAAATGVTSKVTIVESAPEAVQDARTSAASYRTGGMPEARVDVIEADAGDGSRLLVDLGADGPDVAIVDPPRAGLSEQVVDALVRMPRLREVIYVSCNARTLVRDLQKLTETTDEQSAPFALTDLAPIDMFPNTPHAEAVARLVRRTPVAQP